MSFLHVKHNPQLGILIFLKKAFGQLILFFKQ